MLSVLKVERHQWPIFFFLISLSSIFWVLTVLSKEYTATVHAQVAFVDYPVDKLAVEEQEVNLQLQVKAAGFSLLAQQFRFFQTIPLSVDRFISKRKGDQWEYFWLGDQSLAEVQEFLPANMQLLHVQPNRISLMLSEKSQKKLPVQLSASVTFEEMFRAKEEWELIPDQVVVSGPKAVLESMEYVTTDELVLQQLNKNYEGELSLTKPTHPDVVYEHQSIQCLLKVEQFTEGVVEVPIGLSNKPRGVELKMFPETVKIHYQVSLDNFDLVNPQQFRAEVRYAADKKRLSVQLLKKPAMVENVRLLPSKVEYLVIKK